MYDNFAAVQMQLDFPYMPKWCVFAYVQIYAQFCQVFIQWFSMLCGGLFIEK